MENTERKTQVKSLQQPQWDSGTFHGGKMGILNCFPKVTGFSVLVANMIISITQSLAREIPNPQEVAGPSPSGFVGDRQLPALR